MEHELKRIVGIRIRAERLARGITQEQLAELIDRTVETVSNLERGKTWPGIETLFHLCTVLNISLSSLFEMDDSGRISTRRAELLVRLRNVASSLSDDELDVAVRQSEILSGLRPRNRIKIRRLE